MQEFLDFISKDVKKYMAEKALAFTDFERAALIFHSDLTINEKHIRLETLAERTTDKNLKTQITERIRVDREDIEAFYNNCEGFIFLAQVFGPKYAPEPDTLGYFKTAKLAYAYAKKTGYEFTIEKQLIISDDTCPFRHKVYLNPKLFTEKSEDELVSELEENCCGKLTYNKNGDLIYFWNSEIDRGFRETTRLQYDDTRFENAFIAVPNPFERGDIVRCIRSGEIGVVFTSREENDARIEKAMSGKMGVVDFFDSGITVDFLTKNGDLSHNHISPAYLEKYEPQTKNSD